MKNDMTPVICVSGGISSAAMYFLIVDKFGDQAKAVFANTNFESSDTYDFIHSIERAGGLKIDWLNNGGKDIWDVFIERGMITAPKSVGGGCMGAYWLKKMPLREYSKGIPNSVDLIGYGADEDDRRERLIRDNPAEKFAFPLMGDIIGRRISWCEQRKIVESRGLELPKAYSEGMPHNNCNRQCIGAGIKFWALLWKDDPDRFAYSESREQEFLASLREKGRKEFTFLRDRRGGETKNLSLTQLRESLERGERFPDDNSRIPCSCAAVQMDLFQLG